MVNQYRVALSPSTRYPVKGCGQRPLLPAKIPKIMTETCLHGFQPGSSTCVVVEYAEKGFGTEKFGQSAIFMSAPPVQAAVEIVAI